MASKKNTKNNRLNRQKASVAARSATVARNTSDKPVNSAESSAPTETVREIVLSVTGSVFPSIRATLAASKGTPSYQIVATVMSKCVDLAIALHGHSPDDVPGSRIDEPETVLELALVAKTTGESILDSLRFSDIEVVAA